MSLLVFENPLCPKVTHTKIVENLFFGPWVCARCCRGIHPAECYTEWKWCRSRSSIIINWWPQNKINLSRITHQEWERLEWDRTRTKWYAVPAMCDTPCIGGIDTRVYLTRFENLGRYRVRVHVYQRIDFWKFPKIHFTKYNFANCESEHITHDRDIQCYVRFWLDISRSDWISCTNYTVWCLLCPTVQLTQLCLLSVCSTVSACLYTKIHRKKYTRVSKVRVYRKIHACIEKRVSHIAVRYKFVHVANRYSAKPVLVVAFAHSHPVVDLTVVFANHSMPLTKISLVFAVLWARRSKNRESTFLWWPPFWKRTDLLVSLCMCAWYKHKVRDNKRECNPTEPQFSPVWLIN